MPDRVPYPRFLIMAWTTITGANTGSIPQGVSVSASIFDAPLPDYTALMAPGLGFTATNATQTTGDNQAFNPVILQAKYDEGVAAGGGGGGSARPTSGLVFPRGN